MSLLKKVWEDPVWSKVIAAAILGAAAIVTTYFAGWWPTFAAFLKNVISLVVADTPVANWLLALLILCSLIGLFLFGIALWRAPGSGRTPFRDYREDNFFGIRWRWGYAPDGDVTRPVAFCPGCDYQIQPRYVSDYRELERIEYRCDDCGALLHEFNIPQEEVESRIVRHIHKKIRAGSWKAQNS